MRKKILLGRSDVQMEASNINEEEEVDASFFQ